QLGARQFRAASSLVESAHRLRGLAALLNDGPDTSVGLVLVRAAPILVQAGPALQAPRAPHADSSSGLLLPLPPVLLKAVRPMAGLLPRSLRWFEPDQAIDGLTKALAVQPDGLLYFALGLLLVQKDRWEEAAEAFDRAAKTSS